MKFLSPTSFLPAELRTYMSGLQDMSWTYSLVLGSALCEGGFYDVLSPFAR